MVQAIREQVTVETPGRIEIQHAQLTPGTRAEVIILLEIESQGPEPATVAAAPVWKDLVALGEAVPGEAWSEVPTDLARNLEHYLYGAPKEKP